MAIISSIATQNFRYLFVTVLCEVQQNLHNLPLKTEMQKAHARFIAIENEQDDEKNYVKHTVSGYPIQRRAHAPKAP